MNVRNFIPLIGLFLSGQVCGQNNTRAIQVDTSITKFRFAANFQGTLVYTLNGPADIKTQNPTAFSITQAPNMSFQSAKDQLNMLFSMSKQNGYTISDLIKRDTIVNGMQAFIISYKEIIKEEGYTNLVFNGVLMNGSTATIFTSGDLSNGKYFDLFRRTFYAIKL
jgi:hypothetical protein